MTIKELCRKYDKCKYCPFFQVCPYDDMFDKPLNELSNDYDTEITKAIIETAKLLQEDNKGSTLTNREWVDLLQRNFNVSRTVAKEMLHGLMTMKQYDNFTKQFIH